MPSIKTKEDKWQLSKQNCPENPCTFHVIMKTNNAIDNNWNILWQLLSKHPLDILLIFNYNIFIFYMFLLL